MFYFYLKVCKEGAMDWTMDVSRWMVIVVLCVIATPMIIAVLWHICCNKDYLWKFLIRPLAMFGSIIFPVFPIAADDDKKHE